MLATGFSMVAQAFSESLRGQVTWPISFLSASFPRYSSFGLSWWSHAEKDLIVKPRKHNHTFTKGSFILLAEYWGQHEAQEIICVCFNSLK